MSLLPLLMACAASPQVRLPDGPPTWQDGYRHGYNSALASFAPRSRSSATGQPVQFVQDPARMQDDLRYRDGWQIGYDVAKTAVELRQRERHQLESLVIR